MPPLNDVVIKISLKKLYQSDKCAKALLDYVASRTNNSQESRVDRFLWLLSEGETLFSRRDLIGTLKKLEELKVGSFIIGRRGQPSRFRWSLAMIGVGKAAKGEDAVTIESVDDVQTIEEEDADEIANEINISEGSIRHVYKLRHDYDAEFYLPANFSTKEAGRLADFIRTLPFESS